MPNGSKSVPLRADFAIINAGFSAEIERLKRLKKSNEAHVTPCPEPEVLRALPPTVFLLWALWRNACDYVDASWAFIIPVLDLLP